MRNRLINKGKINKVMHGSVRDKKETISFNQQSRLQVWIVILQSLNIATTSGNFKYSNTPPSSLSTLCKDKSSPCIQLFSFQLVRFSNRSCGVWLAKLGLALVSIFLRLVTLYFVPLYNLYSILASACLCRGLVKKISKLATNRQPAVFIELLHNQN